MGQYYKPIVVKEDYENEHYPCIISFKAWFMGELAKLIEHCYIGNPFVEMFAQMIHRDNPKGFNDNRVVWCGDYGKKVNSESLYELAKRVDTTELHKYINETPLPYRYVLNLDKEQYVKMKPYDENECTIHPLPLLIASGNGEGGGDYDGNDIDKVGIWAFDHVCVANEIPEGFTELVVDFHENE